MLKIKTPFIHLLLILLVSSCQLFKEKKNNTLTCPVDWEEVELSPAFPSEITAIMVQEGEKVKKSEILVSLQTSDIKIQLEGLKAGLKSANHRLKSLKIRRDFIKRNLKKARNLYNKGGASLTNIDELEVKLSSIEEEISALEEQIKSQKSKEKLLLLNLERTFIKAPTEGIVTKIAVDVGERVLPGQIIARISNPDETYAVCYVSHSLLSSLKREDRVVIRGFDGTQGEGEITFISDEPEFTPRYYISDNERDVLHYRVKVKINKGRIFKRGEFVKVFFPLKNAH